MTAALTAGRPSAVRGEEVRDEAGRTTPLPMARTLRVALIIVFIGITVLRPQISGGLAMIDPLIGLLCLWGLMSMIRVGSPATRCLARALPWMWLILVGSVLGLATVGITAWAIESLLQTTLALLTFFCFWHLIDVYDLEETAKNGVVLGLLVAVLALVLVPYKYRAEGYFPNPNYPGHFGVLAVGLLLSIGSRRVRTFALIAGAVVLWTTASFGAMLMAGVMIAVVVLRAVERHEVALTLAMAVLVLGTAFVLLSPPPEVEEETGSWEVKGVINEQRFERSQESRLARWEPALESFTEKPFGVGPNGIKYRVSVDGWYFEVHSEPIGFLVERGVIGLVGLIGVWVVIWRAARPFGVARLLIVASVVASIVRETIHYRHMWIFLALAMAVDHSRERRRDDGGSVVPGRLPGGYPDHPLTP